MVHALVVIAVVLLLAAVVAGWSYNRLTVLRNRYRNAFSQIDVQLKRRHDLVPPLVETAKGYLAHERGLLEELARARSRAEHAAERARRVPGVTPTMAGLAGAEMALGGLLGNLFAVMEGYPQLRGDQTMARLMEELTHTENRIAFARQAYNDAVMRFNNACETLPHAIIASSFGFEPAAYFELDNASERLRPARQLDHSHDVGS